MLRSRSITTFSEIQHATPSLHISTPTLGASSVMLASRGLALTDLRLNIDPVVAVYLDGVYLPRTVGIDANELLDIQRVEILAGPQGTLFGKNASGGAVNFFTQQPTDQFEGLARGRIGSYGDRALSLVLNAPLSDDVAARVVGSLSGRDGYGTNFFDGSKAGKLDSRYIRGTLQWKPDRMTMTLRGDYTRTEATQPMFKGFQLLSSPVPAGPTGLGGPLATLETALQLNNLPDTDAFLALPEATRDELLRHADAVLRTYATGDPDDGNVDQPGGETDTVWGVSGTLEYEASDAISLKSITAYRAFWRTGSADLDGTPFNIIQYPFMDTRDHQFSQELQISGTFLDDRLKSIIGAYYSDEAGREIATQTSLPRIGGVPFTVQSARASTKTRGVFTQSTFDVTPEFSVTGGLRYSKDIRSIVSSNHNPTMCLSLGLPLASVGGLDGCERPTKVNYGRVSYTGILEYKPQADLLIYATTRHSYRSGGLQSTAGATSVAAADVAFTPYAPEVVTDYEFGVKSQFLDRRVRANVAVYRSNIEGAIRLAPTPIPGTTASAARLQNASQIKVTGVEFDVTALPLPGLELSVSGAYMDAGFKKYLLSSGEDLSHLPVNFAPEWRVNLSGAYSAQTDFGSWRVRFDFSHVDRQLVVERRALVPARQLLNGRMSLLFDGPGIEVAAFAKNITNERYVLLPTDIAAMGFILNGNYNPPRTFGLELTKRF
jgi:iron complex outermembrane receptor protein